MFCYTFNMNIQILHYTAGWIISEIIAILFFVIFLIASWSKCKSAIVASSRFMFLNLSFVFIVQSTMPILLIRKDYEIKFFFETILLIAYVALLYTVSKFIYTLTNGKHT